MAFDVAIEGIKEFAQSGAGPVADFFKHWFGEDIFDIKASAMGGGLDTDSIRDPESIQEAATTSDAMKVINDVINEKDVPEPPPFIINTAFGFDNYLDDLIRDIDRMTEKAEPLSRIDAFSLTNYEQVAFSPDDAQHYLNEVDSALKELQNIKAELEQLQKNLIDGGTARADYAHDVHDRLVAAEERLAKAASSIRVPLLQMNA